MNTLFAAMLGGWEIVLILAVVLILFGAKKLPELAKGLGQGIKEFKKATTEVSNEIHTAMDDNRYSQPPDRPGASLQACGKPVFCAVQQSLSPIFL
ncbi:MAG: twin-arginine translocase TatA/TatE family subunit [Verrucomicrobia bacterium]|nr:twin-arginine translocase TatA/TatE family subunit [Verrucomicrobiota bacterium]